MYKNNPKRIHGSDMMGGVEKSSGKPKEGVYRNEVDEPKHQKIHRGETSPMDDWKLMDGAKYLKSQAADQAYGASGMSGCKSDVQKIHSQAFAAYSDDTGF